jgi:predicted nucleotidyltransferase
MNYEPFPAALPTEKQTLLRQILDELRSVQGLTAVVLGGSYARGTQHPDSDMDIGLYYAEDAPFALDDIRQIAQKISTGEPPTVTAFYEWGAWVNGGAWIHTAAGKVDFLYRNVDHVRRVIQDAQAGQVQFDFFQQPPYGFHSVIYLAETAVCLPLYDPQNVIRDLKQSVAVYPAALKQTIIQDSLWGAEFTLSHAQTFARSADVYNTVGCLTRTLSYLTQVLFALNETYFMSDKKAIQSIEAFALRPPDYGARVSRILAGPGSTSAALSGTVQALRLLFEEITRYAQAGYTPQIVYSGLPSP